MICSLHADGPDRSILPEHGQFLASAAPHSQLAALAAVWWIPDVERTAQTFEPKYSVKSTLPGGNGGRARPHFGLLEQPRLTFESF